MGDMQHRLFSDAGHGDGGALDALASRDGDIARVLAAYGPPPDRSLPANFDTLARAVIGQQVSRAAAGSIHNRMLSAGMKTADSVIRKSIDDLMQVGLSRRKAEYLIGIADEIVSGRLNMVQLAAMPGEEVQARLVAIRGIGAWTADNFRLFALADMDAWPVNDVALQEAMRRLRSLEKRPSAAEMEAMGEGWRPYRGAGALVLWHLYGVEVRKTSVTNI